MLTREELARMRARMEDAEYVVAAPRMISTLLDFAEQMLPIRDALLAKMAAKVRERVEVANTEGVIRGGSRAACAMREYDLADAAFWALARELAETDAKVEP